MKTNKYYLKAIPLLLSLILLMQSCYVYDSVPVTSEKAIDAYQGRKGLANKRVKIISDSHKLEFKYLSEKDGKIYGVARKKSKTARLLVNQIEDSTKRTYKKNKYNMIEIPLTNEQSREVYPLNRVKTGLKTALVALPVGVAAALGMGYLFGLYIINNL